MKITAAPLWSRCCRPKNGMPRLVSNASAATLQKRTCTSSVGTRPICRNRSPVYNAHTYVSNSRYIHRSRHQAQQALAQDSTESQETDIAHTLSYFDPIQLRDACKCHLCIDGSTKQRNFNTSQIPTDVGIETIEYPGPDSVRITWKNDIPTFPSTHVSEYNTKDLRSTAAAYYDNNLVRSKRVPWTQQDYANDKSVWVKYDDFLHSEAHFKQALANLLKYGLVFITDAPSDLTNANISPDVKSAVSTIAQRIGPLYNSFYGETWDVRSVPSAKNVAYTNVDLGFHMDLMYKETPPYLQLLHCVRNSQAGGESLFVDTFKAAQEMWNRGPEGQEHFKTLTQAGVTFEYRNDGQRFHHIRKTFNLEDDPDSLSALDHHQQQPAMALNDVYYSPPFQGPLSSGLMDVPGGQAVSMAKLVKALAAFEKELHRDDLIFQVKMEPGTCVIFENLRVAHARRSFTNPASSQGGERWLRGAYVGKDDYHSKLHGLGIVDR